MNNHNDTEDADDIRYFEELLLNEQEEVAEDEQLLMLLVGQRNIDIDIDYMNIDENDDDDENENENDNNNGSNINNIINIITINTINTKFKLTNNHSCSCPICFEDLTDGSVVETNCNHLFCYSCIEKQINYHKNKDKYCGLCRSKITQINVYSS